MVGVHGDHMNLADAVVSMKHDGYEPGRRAVSFSDPDVLFGERGLDSGVLALAPAVGIERAVDLQIYCLFD